MNWNLCGWAPSICINIFKFLSLYFCSVSVENPMVLSLALIGLTNFCEYPKEEDHSLEEAKTEWLMRKLYDLRWSEGFREIVKLGTYFSLV